MRLAVKPILFLATMFAAASCDISGQIQDALDDLNDQLAEDKYATIEVSVKRTQPQTFELGGAPGLAEGHITPDGLASLKYFILNMGICEDADIESTGFNTSGKCIELYSAPEDPDIRPGPANLTPDDWEDADLLAMFDAARADAKSGYVDLMAADDLARFTNAVTVTTDFVGDYVYGYIYWAYPIKYIANMTLGNGVTIYTHDGDLKTSIDHNDVRHYNTEAAVGSFVTGPAEEAVVMNPNGGTWFKFQYPFSITIGDVTEGTSYSLDLAFNPHGAIRGCECYEQLSDGTTATATHGFELPILDLSPVPHKANETVSRESYLFDVSSPSVGHFQVRYDLYVVDQDPARKIWAVETKNLYADDTTTGVPHSWNVSFIETATDGALTFLKWDDAPILSSFKRGDAANDAVSANYHCDTQSADPQFNICGGAEQMTITGKLVGIFPL